MTVKILDMKELQEQRSNKVPKNPQLYKRK